MQFLRNASTLVALYLLLAVAALCARRAGRA